MLLQHADTSFVSLKGNIKMNSLVFCNIHLCTTAQSCVVMCRIIMTKLVITLYIILSNNSITLMKYFKS